MIKAAIEKIVALVNQQKGEVQEIEDRKYYFHGASMTPIMTPIIEDAFQIKTLTGLGDYLTLNPDGLKLDEIIVEALSPTQVVVTSVTEMHWRRREKYLVASHVPKAFPFDKYIGHEDFIVSLQAYFLQDDTTAKLLGLLTGIVDDGAINYTDDGMSQQVVAKQGISLKVNVTIPNPVTLSPYRTFLEVDQPPSKFVFRIKKGDNGPMCALFGADGNMWELEAIQRIRDWLRVNVPKDVTILA